MSGNSFSLSWSILEKHHSIPEEEVSRINNEQLQNKCKTKHIKQVTKFGKDKKEKK